MAALAHAGDDHPALGLEDEADGLPERLAQRIGQGRKRRRLGLDDPAADVDDILGCCRNSGPCLIGHAISYSMSPRPLTNASQDSCQ
jgi:hypothetical protein